jgi:NAD+ synthase (glutamine-hydrolysing)
MLQFISEKFNYPSLALAVDAVPTAELQPVIEGVTEQTDEEEMGMTYEELFFIARLRKMEKCGPLSMFRRLVDIWTHLAPADIAWKVKHFFRMYSINRHK